MCATTPVDERHEATPRLALHLYVSWQVGDRGSFVPVGVLTQLSGGAYDFRYLRGAEAGTGFRPFIGFPDLHHVYRSTELFPFFENRLMPRSRSDHSSYLGALALPEDADPFEILARSGGRRATDTIEVVAEPVVDQATGHATCHFLVRGVRHVPGAEDAIDGLAVGDLLRTEPDAANEYDEFARLLVTLGGAPVGYLPSYLSEFVHRSARTGSDEAIKVSVVHIGDRDGPSHFRLLCRLVAAWPAGQPPFAGKAFEPLVPEGFDKTA